ncbi:GL25464 [Drosophila persimilis]|uniref:GL25464 n=1 Tax=Drosophila persimilis TaxID=7234 RepID=B4IRV7_DROPE|nr:GL25464 [Drosophila persimilis]
MRAFIESNFKLLDIDSDGIVGVKEYRYNCITRVAIDDISPIDKAFETLLNVSNHIMKNELYLHFN